VLRRLCIVATALLAAGTDLSASSLTFVREIPLTSAFHNVVGFDAGARGIVVADRDLPAVLLFDLNGRLVRSFSQPGSRHCEITAPEAVAFTPRGIAVWDQKRHHLLRFTSEGVCVADDTVMAYEVDRGALARGSGDFIAAGDTLSGPQCSMFSIVDTAPSVVRTCFHTAADQQRWLLYGRSYIAVRGSHTYFAVPYDSSVWHSEGLRSATLLPGSGEHIATVPVPANEAQIRSSRRLYYDYYATQTSVDGLAAVTAGVVVVTGSPHGPQRELTLTLIHDGGAREPAVTRLVDQAKGAYAAVVRGDGDRRVFVLLAHGSFPSTQYSVLMYETR
jgi:hypothetical protein